MTKSDLYDWVLTHGCKVEPLAEYKAKVLHIKNPINNFTAWISLPIDNEKKLNDMTVFKVCSCLKIEIPTFAEYMRDLDNRIENDNC